MRKEMNFKRFLTDRVTLLRRDGTAYENVDASVQEKFIFIADVSLPVECDDKIKRRLPSGVEEIFVITDPGFQQAFGSIAAHYQARYQREGTAKPAEPTAPRGNVTYNVSGSHSRINVNSLDKSINISDTAVQTTLDQVRTLLQDHVADAEERERLLAKVEELQQVHGTEKFVETYREFMQMAADHMTVIAPLVPALTALL